jgi:hypothetical protein
MSNEKFTQLPGVVNATMADIVASVQSGTSVQETLGQIFQLFLGNSILSFAGNPNGFVAGTIYQLLWDSTDDILYVCSVSGNTATTVWTPCVGQLTNGQILIGRTGLPPVRANLISGTNITITNGPGTISIAAIGPAAFSWTEVMGSLQAMLPNNGYIANNASLVNLALPLTSIVGDQLAIVGKGTGLFGISQAAGQTLHLGASSTTVGTGGATVSTNQFDSIYLVCTVANTTWTTLGGVQGNFTIV